MKNSFSIKFLSLIIFFTVLVNYSFAIKKDSIIIIKKAPSPERLKEIQEKKKADSIALAIVNKKNTSKTDSSRFVKRDPKNKLGTPASNSVFNVSKLVYGSYADYIANYVKNYHSNHGQRLARIQSSNKAYFKLIDNVMKRYSVPREMKSLAIIESAMNCNAVSPVGAVGPWQFMEGTAKMLGLRVDETIDERRDFYKSTNAAARYLKKLHSMFHDWLLVIASYNCGPAPVLRAINAGKGNSFWDIKSKLPGETQNHVMAFIATTTFLDKYSNVLSLGSLPKEAKALITKQEKTAKLKEAKVSKDAKDVDEVDVDDNDNSTVDAKEVKPKFTPEELSQMAILKVKGTYNLQTISVILDEDLVRLKHWNPDFDTEILQAQAPIHLRIPMNKIEKFIIEKDKIIAESAKKKM